MDEITLILGDCLEEMKKIPDKSVDLVITDPPYILDCSLGGGFYKNQKKKHLDRIDKSFGSNFNPNNFLEVVKAKSKNGYLVWMSQKQLHLYLNFIENTKFKWDLMFWHKINCCPNHYNHLLVDTEYCIRFYESGAYFNNKLEYTDYHKYFLERLQAIKGHPTPKPLSIIKKQIKLYSKENDIILDPFMGSGTTGMACKELGRKFIGIEINEKYYKIAEQRIKNTMRSFI